MITPTQANSCKPDVRPSDAVAQVTHTRLPYTLNFSESESFKSLLNREITIQATQSPLLNPSLTLQLKPFVAYLSSEISRQSHQPNIHLIKTTAAQAVGGMESMKWELRVDGPNKTDASEISAYRQVIEHIIQGLISIHKKDRQLMSADEMRSIYGFFPELIPGGCRWNLGHRITVEFLNNVFHPVQVEPEEGFQVTVPGGDTCCFFGHTAVTSSTMFQSSLTQVIQRPYSGTSDPIPIIPLIHALSQGANSWEEDWTHAKTALRLESLSDLCRAWVDFQRTHCQSPKEKWLAFLNALHVAEGDRMACQKLATMWLYTQQQLHLTEGIPLVQALENHPELTRHILNGVYGTFLLNWVRHPEKGLNAFALPFIDHPLKPRSFAAFPCPSGTCHLSMSRPSQTGAPADIGLNFFSSMESLESQLPELQLEVDLLDPVVSILGLNPIESDVITTLQEVIDAWDKQPLKTILKTNYHHDSLHRLIEWKTRRTHPNLDRDLLTLTTMITNPRTTLDQIIAKAEQIPSFPIELIKHEKQCGPALMEVICLLNLRDDIPANVIDDLFTFGFKCVFKLPRLKKILINLGDRDDIKTLNLIIKTFHLHWKNVPNRATERRASEQMTKDLISHFRIKSASHLKLAIVFMHIWMRFTPVKESDSLNLIRHIGMQLLNHLPSSWKTLDGEPKCLADLRKSLIKSDLLSTSYSQQREDLIQLWPALQESQEAWMHLRANPMPDLETFNRELTKKICAMDSKECKGASANMLLQWPEWKRVTSQCSKLRQIVELAIIMTLSRSPHLPHLKTAMDFVLASSYLDPEISRNILRTMTDVCDVAWSAETMAQAQQFLLKLKSDPSSHEIVLRLLHTILPLPKAHQLGPSIFDVECEALDTLASKTKRIEVSGFTEAAIRDKRWKYARHYIAWAKTVLQPIDYDIYKALVALPLATWLQSEKDLKQHTKIQSVLNLLEN